MFEEFFGGNQALDFDEFANHLLEQGQNFAPSKLQGSLCGLLVGDASLDAEFCLAGISQSLEIELHGALADATRRLVSATLDALIDEEFEFHLFMPDDEIELEQRVDALAQWSRGFLAGYAFSVAQSEAAAPGDETAEILRDVAAIAEADHDQSDDEESAEHDFFELSEYLRFATINLYLDARERQGIDG